MESLRAVVAARKLPLSDVPDCEFPLVGGIWSRSTLVFEGGTQISIAKCPFAVLFPPLGRAAKGWLKGRCAKSDGRDWGADKQTLMVSVLFSAMVSN